MSVIAEFQVPASDFELGRILAVEGLSTIQLESLVPTGESTVPLFWIHNATREPFLESVQQHPAVNTVAELEVFADRTLFSLDWDARADHLFAGIRSHEGQLLSAVGTPSTWEFELRFPDHDALSEFTTHCDHAAIALEVTRVYNPTEPEAEPWYGLTEPQREALRLAVERGYYDIPRGCTTEDLSAALGISDQAVTERLRRAIGTLVSQTLLPADDDN
jgi:predicted DNA binding protein